MLGRKRFVQRGMVILAFTSFSVGTGFEVQTIAPENPQIVTLKNDSLLSQNKRSAKKDTSKTSETIADNATGVVITTSGNSLENLADDEVFIEETKVKREFVLEEEFKLWRIYVSKGRKTIDYRKVEVPYGTYFKKNHMDITEEVYNLETKDLPEGETKRYKRDEYEAKERERINQEIMNHFQIRSIPLDSAFIMNNSMNDTIQGR